MKNQDKPKKPATNKDSKSKTDLKGYPLYPETDDIYSRLREEQDIDPENPGKKKMDADFNIDEDEEELEGDVYGDDLDVPGSELDDENEDIGNEDEENNYYSIGGDNHNNLEEDHDEE